jgi:catechol 2,3-dioxygenase-like lactoylglutathione lyase family enzyme
MTKIHIALNTPSFDASVAFYRAFFGREPVKHKPGYAKFDLDQPGLNLTLNEGEVREQGALNHLGIQVESSEAVTGAVARLRAAGLATEEERGVDCCYALQDKVWVSDPNGYRWEVFVVKVGDTRPDLTAEPVATAGPGAAACCDSTCCAAS